MRQRKITPTNLFTLDVSDIIKVIHERVMGDMPEGIKSTQDLVCTEEALGRLANDYAYIIELLSYSRNYVRQLKRKGEREQYEDMMDKRDALESISSALKLKYQAVSRTITVIEQADSEGDMHAYRKERNN